MILSDICEFIVDCPHSTAPDEGAGYPLIRTPNVGKGRLILDNVHRVSEAVYKNRNVRATPREGDIILAREAPAGNAALITKGQNVCLGQRTVLIRPDKTKVDPRFLTYYLLTEKSQNLLLGRANGATVPHINLPIIRSLEIDAPKLEDQRRIGNVLALYDDLIENNNSQIKLLEEAALLLYKEWFVKFNYPVEIEKESAQVNRNEWKEGTLGEIASFQRGKNLTKKEAVDGDIPVVAGGLEPSCYHSQSNTFEPVVTVSASGANAGFTRLYMTNVWASDCSFIDARSKDVFFVYCFLKSQPELLKSLQKGSAQPHVYASDLNGIKTAIPCASLLGKFNNICSSIFGRVKLLEKQISLVSDARNILLPKLMSGEIEV